MQPFRQSMRSHGGYEGPAGNRTIARANDLTRKGQATLDLLDQVADTMSASEERLEARLLQALDQLKTAEDRISVLTARASQAESRASEAEKWLSRLHDEMEIKLASGIQSSEGRMADLAPSGKVPDEVDIRRLPNDDHVESAGAGHGIPTEILLPAEEWGEKRFDLKKILNG